jgi:hypothetical protein
MYSLSVQSTFIVNDSFESFNKDDSSSRIVCENGWSGGHGGGQ